MFKASNIFKHEDIIDKLIERLYVELDIFGFYDLKKFVK